jgi:hypothetical protein
MSVARIPQEAKDYGFGKVLCVFGVVIGWVQDVDGPPGSSHTSGGTSPP